MGFTSSERMIAMIMLVVWFALFLIWPGNRD